MAQRLVTIERYPLYPDQVLDTLNKTLVIFCIRGTVCLPQQAATASADVWAEEQFLCT
jgi:hypothetical protein